MFSQLLDKINYDVVSALSKFEVQVEEDIQQMEADRRQALNQHHMEFEHAGMNTLQDSAVLVSEKESIKIAKPTFAPRTVKVGRNDPCPCGSGKKYKQCHGSLD
jgi:preprotein translocase subunit SecA